MPTILLSAKFWGVVGLVGVLTLAGAKLSQWGDERFAAGYDSRDLEVKTANEKAQLTLNTAETRENEKALQLEKMLAKSRKRSDALAAQIRNASFTCIDIGGEFVRLFNEGTRADN